MNYMGARFSADRAAMGPLMAELGRRGLLYLDDGSSARSLAPELALKNGVPFAAGDTAIDAVQDRGAILKKLDELEATARAKGFAIGIGSAFDMTVDTVVVLGQRGQEARHRDRADFGGGHRSGKQAEAMAERSENGRSGDAALPPLRRHDGAQRRRPGLGRPSHCRAGQRIRRRDAALADAARRHRQGRGTAAGGASANSTRRPACAASRLLAEAPDWINYDLPPHLVGIALKGRYRGQTQKWFAFRFHGDESEIQINPPPGGHEAEFDQWAWRPMPELPGPDRAVQAQGL